MRAGMQEGCNCGTPVGRLTKGSGRRRREKEERGMARSRLRAKENRFQETWIESKIKHE